MIVNEKNAGQRRNIQNPILYKHGYVQFKEKSLGKQV